MSWTPPVLVDGVDVTRGFQCAECGHRHTGINFAFICIGCPCDIDPDNGTVDKPEPVS